MGCGIQWGEINRIDSALRTLRRYGIPETSDAYQLLWGVRGSMFGQLGFRRPTIVTLIKRLLFGSPARFRLWYDSDGGWLAESREAEGAHPTYKAVSTEVAMAMIKEELTPAMEEMLLAPDTYYGA